MARPCFDTARTQFELNECAHQEAIRADRDMNALYGKLLSRVAKNPQALAAIRNMQRDWLSLRNAYMLAMFPDQDRLDYGSVFPMEYNDTRASVTSNHIADLKLLLIQYNHGLQCGRIDGEC
jgi:uncharacterized protein YecT (DUF1311 family)